MKQLLVVLSVALSIVSTTFAASVSDVENRMEGMRAAGPSPQYNAARVCLLSAKEIERTQLPLHADLAAIAAACLDAKDKSPVFSIEQGDHLILANAQTAMLFAANDAGIDLRAMYRADKDYQFLRWVVGPRPLWGLKYFKTGGEWPKAISSTYPATNVKHDVMRDDKGLTLKITWSFDHPFKTATTMTVTLPADSSLSQWTLDVDHTDPRVGLGSVEFPMIRGVGLEDNSGSDFLAVPEKSGWLYYDPGRNADFSGFANLGFTCYYTKDHAGLYLSASDPDGNAKDLIALADSGMTAMSYNYPAPDSGKTPNRLTFHGTVGSFSGDWYDGCQIYRGWALKQKWVPKQTFLERDDLPKWYKEHAMCIRAAGDPKLVLPRIKKIAAKLDGIPATVQWYGCWADPKVKPSTNDLERFPEIAAYPGMKEAVAEMNKLGCYVAEAYHEPRLWAEDSASYKALNGAAAAQRDNAGNIIYARFGNFPLTSCCPMSPATVQAMTDATLTMVRDYGVKGIYGDLVGTVSGYVCYADNHGHPVGGGNAHAEGQRQLMKHIRAEARKIDPEFTSLVENCDERILDSFDSYISFFGCNLDFQINIPMTRVVYGDYTISGASKAAGLRNGVEEEMSLAQMFVWGDIVGRFWSEVADDPGRAAEMDQWMKLAHWHHSANKWFVGAQMMRPLEIRYEAGATPSDAEKLENRIAVQQASHKATDGSVLFAFYNSRVNKPKTFSCTIDPKEYQIPTDGTWSLYQMMDENGTMKEIAPIKDAIERNETMAPRGILMLIAKPSK